MPETNPIPLPSALPSLLPLVRARAAFFTDANGEPHAELCAADVVTRRSPAPTASADTLAVRDDDGGSLKRSSNVQLPERMSQ
jgi:hypothetical protein